MQKPRRSLPNFNNPEALLKQLICKCGKGIKLSVERYCEDCALDVQIRKEHPELTTAGNWRLRTKESREASYRTKQQKNLFARLRKLEFRIDYLYVQKKIMPENSKALDKNISKLLDKRTKTSEAYEALLTEPTFNKHAAQQQPEDEKETAIRCLRSLVVCAQRIVDDELRYQT